MDVGKYLERIGYRGGREQTAANLSALVRAHRIAVPYETLEIWRHRRTTLDPDELFDRIVTHRRGGYCLELNGLFAALLRELGYDVSEHGGRWLMGEKTPVPKISHRVICVAIPGGRRQIADVGIGLPHLPSPIDFAFDVPQVCAGRVYRVVRDPVLKAVVEMRSGSDWERIFSFDTEPWPPIDFEYAHWWYQTHPDSSFLSKLWVFRFLADGGALTISPEEDPERGGAGGKTLALARFDSRGEMELTFLRSEAALRKALGEEFGIVEPHVV